jgi:ATP-binding cassette subfamily F protein 3
LTWFIYQREDRVLKNPDIGKRDMAGLPQILLQLKNGVKNFGARSLFEGASFAVNEGEKVGVIGPNGAGKSTLFKILVGLEDLDRGEITRMTGLRLGYLAQDENWRQDITVEEALTEQSMTPVWELKQMAPSFGLSLDHFDKPVMSLSGGYRMRVKLLHLLGSQPDLMLLDEPTNYLDLETLVVLENFLQGTNRAFLLISHDREFLRRVTDHILEIEAGQMTKYAGNIDDYFEQKELLRSQLAQQALSLQAKRNEVLDFAARFGAKATKARQVQSRLKSLDRMESIEIKALPTQAQIRLPEPARTGKSVMQIQQAELGYTGRVILKDLAFELNKGDHLGVVGVNGAGKSTLLKALAGELAPLVGEIKRGLNVEVAYFAQHVAERLDPEMTVIQAMGQFAHAEVKRQEILDLAGSLLFSGESSNKKISVLSGGEKSRVALGQMLLKRASCLLLDEPTNHLDFDTVEALTQALSAYSGSVVIVSHDRGFVSRTATKVLEIRNGRAEFYPGTYDEYVWSVQKGVLSARQFQLGGLSGDAGGNSARRAGEDTPKINFKDKKKNLEKEIRATEKEMSGIDAKNEKLRNDIISCTEKLLNLSGLEASQVAKELAGLQAEVEANENRYLELLESHDFNARELVLMENRRTD